MGNCTKELLNNNPQNLDNLSYNTQAQMHDVRLLESLVV